ncbi:MAG TPA: ferritin-like domain-containing protein [Novosphingobium sp.]
MTNFPSSNRRSILAGGVTTLSAAGLVALLGSSLPAEAKRPNRPGQDVQLLNAALELEHEGIAAYQIAAESGLLSADVLKVGITFQSHHKTHRDDLAAAIRRLGGQAATGKSIAEYVAALGAAALKTQNDVLKLALQLERGAANAYLGLIPSLEATEFHLLSARMAGDEAFHAAILGNALNEPIPQKAPIFG